MAKKYYLSSEVKPSRNEEIFIAGVVYLAKKYKIDTFNLVTKNGYHIEGIDDAELNLRRELVKIFQK